MDTPEAELPAYLSKLNAPQREAALATEGPLIVFAGAGSGKTRMLTARVAYLIGHLRVRPYQVLAVTFTNKAAAEMRERVTRALEDAGELSQLGSPEIGTFHSICLRILRREADRTPYSGSFVVYDDSDQLSLIKSVMAKLNIDVKAINPKSIQAAINRAKCDAIEPEQIADTAQFQPGRFGDALKRVYPQYQTDLFANNAIDFGEIIVMAYRVLRDNPDVREKYQRRFRYIHVDEYQDTNHAQYLFLSQLAKRENGGHGNICVVGDEDQSIYGWRGADISNILEFEHDFPDAKEVKLEQNYRSSKTIITAASEVIRHNRTRKDKQLWTDNDEGVPVARVQVPDERAEAEIVIGEIKRLASDGYGLNDFAVFYRTHAQSRQIEDVLRRERLQYQIVGGLRFYDRKEIKDIMAYLRVVMNPADSISIKRIINTPARGIGKTTIDKLDEMLIQLEQDREEHQPLPSLWSVLQRVARGSSGFASRTAGKIRQFVELVERFHRDRPKLTLLELYHLILDETSMVAEYRKEGTPEALARVENLEEFNTVIEEFEDDVFLGMPEGEREVAKESLLERFLEQTTLASSTDQSFDPSAVKLMTFHASKGLEFPVVFMVGMEEGLFPSVKAWEETPPEEIEEERRLCYVGMTRARERLYMLNAVTRRIWGQFSYQDPARFFDEIPTKLVEFHDLARNMERSYGGGSYGGGAYGSPRRPAAGNYGSLDNDGDSDGGWSQPRGEAGRSHAAGSARPAVWDEYSQVEPELVGQKIEHPSYGRGVIISAEGTGDEAKITVEFAGRVQRKFLMRFLKKFLGV